MSQRTAIEHHERLDHMAQLLVEHGTLTRRQKREFGERYQITERTVNRDIVRVQESFARLIAGGEDAPRREEIAGLLVERTEAMWRIAVEAGDVKGGLAAIERLAKLHGVDAPSRLDVTVTPRAVSPAELRERRRAVLARAERFREHAEDDDEDDAG